MTTFKDRQGREWNLVLDIPTCRSAKKLGVDLIDMKVDAIGKLAAEPLLLVDLLWNMCREQAESSQVTEEQFQKGMGGDAIDASLKAIKETVVEFFPESKRDGIRSVHAHHEKLQQDGEIVAVEKMVAKREKILATMNKLADEEIDKLLGQLESSPDVRTRDDL